MIAFEESHMLDPGKDLLLFVWFAMEGNCMRRVLYISLSLIVAVGGPLVSGSAQTEEVFLQVAIGTKDATVVKEQPSGLVTGEVMKVDNEMSKIVIKHQELTDLGMPAMTMVFSVPDRSLLDGVKAGEKVKFTAQLIPHGLAVTEIKVENN